jgi:hypothetical protein
MVNTTTRWTFGVLQRERTEQKAKFSEYSIKRKAELSTGSRKRSAWEKHTGTAQSDSNERSRRQGSGILKAVLRIRDVYPGSRIPNPIFSIPDPGSWVKKIPNPVSAPRI